jgi:hypothetical protein
MMTSTQTITKTSKTAAAEARELVKWVFLREMKAITCEIRSTSGGGFDVCVLPHWNISSGIVEQYDELTAALRRHAEIALSFRQTGWLLVREGLA